MISLNIAILIPFLAAFLIPFFYRAVKKVHVGWFALIVPVVLFVYLASYTSRIASGEVITDHVAWIPSYGINFTTYLDGLSLIFALLITGIGSLVILYSIYYLSSDEPLGNFYVYLMMFMGAMLGVVMSDNTLVLYVFWELTSISSFLLIAFWFHRKRSREGAQKSLLITVTGGIGMLVGFILLYLVTGTWSIRETIALLPEITEHQLFIPAMLLILLGAFTKSVQFPFHIWLPSAMEAPTPVSAYLHSATMVKAGIYLVARFTPVFGGDAIWFWLVSGVGIVTLFWGSFNAVKQTDLKALLAFSTISQLGMIMTMFGIGSAALYFGYSSDSVLYTQATFAALFHLVNHSTFKGALFMIVGIVDHEVGTRDIRRLGGLATLMPITFTVAVIGSLSMAGLPPFNGFLSKEMFFTSVLQAGSLDIFSLETWGVLFPIIAWVASIFTFIYCLIIIFQTFLGEYHEERLEHPAKEPPYGMLISPVILGLLVIGIFFFPNVLGDYLLRPAMAAVYPSFYAQGEQFAFEISAWHGFNTELFMTIGVVIFGLLLYFLFKYWKRIYTIVPENVSFDTVYNFGLEQLDQRSNQFTKWYMTGHLRDYFVYIFLFFIIVVGGVFARIGVFDIDLTNDAPITTFEWLIVITMMVSAVFIIFAKSRLTAILLNGALGYSVAVMFVMFQAPDLALTQAAIETITTVLFLVAYYFLPEWKKEDAPKRTKVINLVISIGVGVVFTVVALSVKNENLFETIAHFFENAYELAGGNNIVNAILGDFRAFDTMLEVVVLVIGGIGVYTLTKLKDRKGDGKLENK